MGHPMRQNLIKPFRGTMIQNAHTLSKRSVFNLLLNEGGGNTVFDSVSKKIGNLNNNPAWITNQRGAAIDFNPGSSHFADFGDLPQIDLSNNELTVIIRTIPRTNSSFFISQAEGTTYDFGCYVSGPGDMTLFYGANQQFVSPTLNIDVTPPTFHFLAYVVGSDGSMRFHMNDEIEENSSAGVTLVENNRQVVINGRWNEGSSYGFFNEQDLTDIIIYNSALTIEDVLLLKRQPFLMLR